MITHNENINFLLLQGWEYDKNRNGNACFRPCWDDEKWFSLNEALSTECLINPDEYKNFELIDNLDQKMSYSVSKYMEE